MSTRRQSKLYRNLKPGDQFRVETGWGMPVSRSAVVTVTKVYETHRAYATGRRQWVVHGTYPWWWTGPIHAYADERVDVCGYVEPSGKVLLAG